MDAFAEFFRAAGATEAEPDGREPYGYQARMARDGLPALVEAPTGTGKTGIILSWLWRRLHADPGSTPRRLVYALPPGSLAEQVAGQAARWLANLGLADQVALHMVMGGAGQSQGDWRMGMHNPAIVIGPADVLVSKALNRGYDIWRDSYPIDFALVTNGAHWVIDEIGLGRQAATTLRQLAAFAKVSGTAEPFGLTCMSAMVAEGSPVTVGNLGPHVIRILPRERTGELAVRLGAQRTIRRLDAEPGDYRAIAATARDRHRAGTLTLVVLNTVEAARAVYQALRDGPVECALVHARFRPLERAGLMAGVTGHPENRIVVATRAAEAGFDLSAAVLITEAAPWPSLVQRAGRCNRTGLVRDAELWWIPPPPPPAAPQPYEQADIDASSAELAGLDSHTVTSEDLLSRDVAVTEPQVEVLRQSDFTALFDTAPNLSGMNIDISLYLRDTEDLDAQLAWATWTAESPAGAPPAEAWPPGADFRCQVPLGQVHALARDIPVWRLDHVLGQWVAVTPQATVEPGEVLLVNAADGGYDPLGGFDPAARGPVPGSPSIDPVAGTEEPARVDPWSAGRSGWVPLYRHSEDTRDHAAALLSVIAPELPDGAVRSAVTAAYLHDVGKAHRIWQDALCGVAPQEWRDEVAAGRPWAKSGISKRLLFEGGVAFRHELASLLILDGPLHGLLADVPDADLARYLVLAHHGKLRVQVRDHEGPVVRPADETSQRTLRGLEEGASSDIPALLGQPVTRLTVSLDQFQPADERSWTRTALGLRDRYGPFVLAYLETIVRIADWRASAGLDVAQ